VIISRRKCDREEKDRVEGSILGHISLIIEVKTSFSTDGNVK
jgi:hypothetical protein